MFADIMSGLDGVGTPSDNDRAFTPKAFLFGLLGIVLISTVAGFVEHRMPLAPPLVGTHQPAGLYFYLMFVALVWSLAVSRLAPALALNTKEMVVVAVMTSTACFPPTSGLFRYFQRQLVLPWYYLNAGGQPEWKKFGILDYIPTKLFPQPAPSLKDGILQLDDTVYRGFFQGLARGSRSIGVLEWPWQAWVEPLLYWGPLIVLMSVCAIALSLLVHRQWATHEN